MLSILRQPHPRFERDQTLFWLCTGAGIFVGLFMLAFQPFGTTHVHIPYKVAYLFGFGAITSFVLLFNYFALPKLFPNWFNEERWTVGKNIVLVLNHFVGIGMLNYAYNALTLHQRFDVLNLLTMIVFTLLIGVFPTAGFTITEYVRKLKKYSHPPQPVALSPQELNQETIQTLQLTAENNKDVLTLPIRDLLYIESADNYSEVVYINNQQVQKELIRSSLSRLETQIPVEFIARCHRSYIVNLHQVERVTGNAQGYKLHLPLVSEPVPVARKHTEQIVRRFQS